MSTIIAIYGKTCTLKSDVARAISRLTGYKMASRGEWITTCALMDKHSSGLQVDLDVHRETDEQTRGMISWPDDVLILESRFMDCVLGGIDGVFLVRLSSSEESRAKRWEHRREQGGGRTRQIGEGVSQRDRDDAELRQKLYPDAGEVRPDMEIDTSDGQAHEIGLKIWAEFTGEDLSYLQASASEEMDKRQTKGLKPGPSAGEVAVYNALRNPFGGYIVDDESGRQVFVHKSAVESAGLEELKKGQRVRYQIVEDGFGGFRASGVAPE